MKWPFVLRKRHERDVRRLQERLAAQADRHSRELAETEEQATLLVKKMIHVRPDWEVTHLGQHLTIRTLVDADLFNNLMNGPMTEHFWHYIGRRVGWEVERRLSTMDFAALRSDEYE